MVLDIICFPERSSRKTVHPDKPNTNPDINKIICTFTGVKLSHSAMNKMNQELRKLTPPNYIKKHGRNLISVTFSSKNTSSVWPKPVH